MTFAVFIPNVKAFYKKLHGVIPTWLNNILLYFGIATYLGLCYLGIFDFRDYSHLHIVSTAIFLGCFTLYCLIVGQCFYWKRAHYLPREQHSIKIVFWCSWAAVINFIVVMIVAPYFDKGNLYWTAIAEWITLML